MLREKLINHSQKPVNQTEARKSHEEAQISTGGSYKGCEVVNQSFCAYFRVQRTENSHELSNMARLSLTYIMLTLLILSLLIETLLN